MTLYNPYSAEGLPADVARLLSRPAPAASGARAPWAGGETEGFGPQDGLEGVPGLVAPGAAEAPGAPPLNRWDIETHVYSKEAKANGGFLAGLFGLDVAAFDAGVVQEAKFYRIDRTEAHMAEIGVAVRLSIIATGFNVKAKVDVPNLIAAAQLSQADTQVRIQVVGSTISIGELIPTPTTINVENHELFLSAFAEIRKRVFAEENKGFFAPELLSLDPLGGTAAGAAQA